MTQTTRRSDQDIQANVSEELLYTPSIDTNVRVAVNGGAVTLSGEVGSLPERLAATRAAMRVSGVKAVADDELRVCAPGTSGANDTDIAQVASQQLGWAVDVPSDTVKAEARDHVITLSGNVTWDYQRDAAARAVMYIKGVTGINNTITLRQGESVSVMKAAVQQAIQRNALLDAQAIKVDVDGHQLTLRGNVRSFAGRRQAEHAAWAAAGVTSVKNHLLVTA
jgi:osmotically-inducible protein OsmY